MLTFILSRRRAAYLAAGFATVGVCLTPMAIVCAYVALHNTCVSPQLQVSDLYLVSRDRTWTWIEQRLPGYSRVITDPWDGNGPPMGARIALNGSIVNEPTDLDTYYVRRPPPWSYLSAHGAPPSTAPRRRVFGTGDTAKYLSCCDEAVGWPFLSFKSTYIPMTASHAPIGGVRLPRTAASRTYLCAIPTTPIWSGLVANWVVLFISLYCISAIILWIRVAARARRQECIYCSYSTLGAVSNSCAECGRSVI
jgi:hypothetical protein